jgi:hypothetical protein
MTYRYFKMLIRDQQVEAVFNEGIFLMNLEKDGLSISLYQINNFYIEIGFSNDNGRIKWINCFEDTGKLTPYLEKIDLPDFTDCWL